MKISFLKIVFTLVFFLLPFWPSIVSAGSEHNMSGWAWSSNIGWISFNSTNTGGSVDYGVNLDQSFGANNGNMSGYAWSSNIGWISFNQSELSGCPQQGQGVCKAKLDGNSLKGWARALSYGGGWDGWISLSGITPNYGVTLSGTSFNGYAWGSDVVGWISFSRVGKTDGVIIGSSVDSCGTSSGTIPQLSEPTAGTSAACGHGAYANSPVNTTTAWNWSCGTVVNCTAPKYGCTVPTDTNYNSTGPNNISGCANTCANNKTNYPTCTLSIPSIPAVTLLPEACDTGKIDVIWSAPGATSYTLLDNNNQIYTGSDAFFIHDHLVLGSIHVYSVSATNSSGSSLYSNPISETALVCGATAGTCSPTHYNCSDGSTGTNPQNFPSKVTWTCPGSGGGADASCSENKGPGFIEN